MISEKQKKILAFQYTDYDAIICDGAVRSGKTSIMMWAFVRWAMGNYNAQRFGICGKTVDSASKNIIIPFISMKLAKECSEKLKNAEENVNKILTENGTLEDFKVEE